MCPCEIYLKNKSNLHIATHLPFSCGGRNGLLEDLLASLAALAAPVRACFAKAGRGRCRPSATLGWPRFGCAGLGPPGSARRLHDITIITSKHAIHIIVASVTPICFEDGACIVGASELEHEMSI